jgi:membrane protein required for beta-lactamase induction
VYFLGRKVYLATAVVLASALRCGVTPVRMRRLSMLVGASQRTLRRWQVWWRRKMPQSPFWRSVSGALMPPVALDGLPLSLLQRFTGDLEHRVIALLRFLAPLGGSHRIRRAV